MGRAAKKAAKQIARVDTKVEDFIDPFRTDRAVDAIGLVGEIGDQPQLRILSGLCALAGVLGSSPRLYRAGARMILALETATLAKNFIKDEVDRKRPRSASTVSDKTPRRGRHSSKEMTSFPSGHTAGAVAVARAFSREFPEFGVPALAAAGIIAGAQVPRSAHYLSDVAAGAAVGAAAEAVSNVFWKD